MKESCDNSDSEIEVCINSDSYPETIDSVAPDEVLGNSTSLWTFDMLTLILEMNQLLNLYRKKLKKTVTLHKVCTPQVGGMHLMTPFYFWFCPLATSDIAHK